MSKYRMTPKGKRTLTASLIMIGSGSVLGVYFKEGLLYALVAIFVFSSLGVLFEIYSGYRGIERQKDLKERMKQTLAVDHSKNDEINNVNDNEKLEEEVPKKTNELSDSIHSVDAAQTSVVTEESPAIGTVFLDGKNIVSADENLKSEAKPINVYKPFGEFKAKDSVVIEEKLEHIQEKVIKQEVESNEQVVPENVAKDKSLVYETIEKTQNDVLEKNNEIPLYRKMPDLINGIKNNKTEWSFDLKFKYDDDSFAFIDYLLISEKGIMVINDMTGYEVISGNSELQKWNCYKTKDDYKNQNAISIENSSMELNRAVEAIKNILNEFDLLLPIYSSYMIQDNCELFVTESSTLEAIKLNQFTSYLSSKNTVPDIIDEMVGILKEIFDMKNENSIEG